MKLESNVPLPDRTTYQFDQMLVGVSFARPSEQTASVKSAASRYKRDHPGWDYTTTVGGGIIRCWCTAVPKARPRKDMT